MYTVHQLEADFWEKGFDFTYTQGDDGIQFSSAFISSELDKQQHLVLGEGFRITFTEEISFLDQIKDQSLFLWYQDGTELSGWLCIPERDVELDIDDYLPEDCRARVRKNEQGNVIAERY